MSAKYEGTWTFYSHPLLCVCVDKIQNHKFSTAFPAVRFDNDFRLTQPTYSQNVKTKRPLNHSPFNTSVWNNCNCNAFELYAGVMRERLSIELRANAFV